MTTSILNDCLLLKDEDPQKIIDYLKKINLTLFDPIIESIQDPLHLKQTILFLLCAYSEDSPLIIIRQDAKEEKSAICEYLQIPELYHHPLIELSDPLVRQAAIQYLERFAGQEFKTLQYLKIQLADFERDTTARVFTTSKDEIIQYDYKEHMKAVTETKRLATLIHQAEEHIKKQENFAAIAQMREWRNTGNTAKRIQISKGGLSLENSSLIKKRRIGE